MKLILFIIVMYLASPLFVALTCLFFQLDFTTVIEGIKSIPVVKELFYLACAIDGVILFLTPVAAKS